MQSKLLSRYFFGDIDGMRHYFISKPIFVVYNLSKLTNNDAKKTELLIIYSFNSCLFCLNNSQDEHCFTEALATLSLFGDGGYLAKCKINILLKVCTRCAIKYHSHW